jgi:hypothetical protein
MLTRMEGLWEADLARARCMLCRWQTGDTILRSAPARAHIFSLLARILRPRVCDDLDSDSTHCYDPLLTIQRGGQQRDFFLTLRHLRENRGVLRYGVRISFDSAGLPRSGKLSIISKDSRLGTPADLFVSHPQPSGEHLKPKDHGFVRLRWEPRSGAQHPTSTFIRFIPLLRGTTLPRK